MPLPEGVVVVLTGGVQVLAGVLVVEPALVVAGFGLHVDLGTVDVEGERVGGFTEEVDDESDVELVDGRVIAAY